MKWRRKKNRTPEQIAEGQKEALRNEKRRQEKLAERAILPAPPGYEGMAAGLTVAFATRGNSSLAGLAAGMRGVKKEDTKEGDTKEGDAKEIVTQ